MAQTLITVVKESGEVRTYQRSVSPEQVVKALDKVLQQGKWAFYDRERDRGLRVEQYENGEWTEYYCTGVFSMAHMKRQEDEAAQAEADRESLRRAYYPMQTSQGDKEANDGNDSGSGEAGPATDSQ